VRLWRSRCCNTEILSDGNRVPNGPLCLLAAHPTALVGRPYATMGRLRVQAYPPLTGLLAGFLNAWGYMSNPEALTCCRSKACARLAQKSTAGAIKLDIKVPWGPPWPMPSGGSSGGYLPLHRVPVRTISLLCAYQRIRPIIPWWVSEP